MQAYAPGEYIEVDPQLKQIKQAINTILVDAKLADVSEYQDLYNAYITLVSSASKAFSEADSRVSTPDDHRNINAQYEDIKHDLTLVSGILNRLKDKIVAPQTPPRKSVFSAFQHKFAVPIKSGVSYSKRGATVIIILLVILIIAMAVLSFMFHTHAYVSIISGVITLLSVGSIIYIGGFSN